MARLIDADAFIKKHWGISKGYRFISSNAVEKEPTVEERKTGYWEEFEFEYADREYVGYKCSECDSRCLTTDFEKYNYCPFCGAKMEDDE